jgi:hypothetical protein
MSYGYVHRTERLVDHEGNTIIVQVVADEDGSACDPRDNDNYTRIYGDHRHYTIGDGKPPSEHQYILDRGGIRLLYRYMRLLGDPANKHSKVLAFTKLGMYDHSGITVYTSPMGSSAEHWADHGGWDSGAVGYVYIAQDRWDLLGGGDPYEAVDGEAKFPLGNIPIKQQRVWHNLEAEVDEYDDWCKGNVWGVVWTKPCDHADEHSSDETMARCPHAESDSVWGFIGDPDKVWPDALEYAGVAH